jgi:hypothetical protein
VKVLNAASANRSAAAVENVKTLDSQIHTLEPLTLGHSVISKWAVRYKGEHQPARTLYQEK